MHSLYRIAPIAVLLLGACASVPSGPTLMALPGSGKSFEQFRSDDYMCRDYADRRVNSRHDRDKGLASAAVGTALGAVAGAAIGGEHGAAVGAGTGLLVGGAVGAGQADDASYSMQRRYDNAYVQCMYAQGHKVPVSGRMESSLRRSYNEPPVSSHYIPPPPDAPPPR